MMKKILNQVIRNNNEHVWIVTDDSCSKSCLIDIPEEIFGTTNTKKAFANH